MVHCLHNLVPVGQLCEAGPLKQTAALYSAEAGAVEWFPKIQALASGGNAEHGDGGTNARWLQRDGLGRRCFAES